MGKMAREGHRTKKRGITLKHLGSSSVFFFLSWAALSLRRVKRTGRLRRGGQADSISPPEMDGGRKDGGVEGWRGEEAGESGVEKEEWSEERGEAAFLNRWKYDDDLSKQQSRFDSFDAFIKQKRLWVVSPHTFLCIASSRLHTFVFRGETSQRTTAEFR